MSFRAKMWRMMKRLQRIYNLWSIHAMFTIFLYDFGMIWLELIRTDAVFSRTTVVLFLWRNKISRNVLKINGDFFLENIKNTGTKSYRRGGPWAPWGWGRATPWARATPLGMPLCLVDYPWGPLTCSRRQPILYIPKPTEINLDQEFHCRKPL